jgi:hypothetical protein
MLSQTSTTCTMKKSLFIVLISFVVVARGQSLLRGRRDLADLANDSCACETNTDDDKQSWKCGNDIYVCPDVTNICSVSGSQNSIYYAVTQEQCDAMKPVEIGDKCVPLPQHGITKPKGLSNRVCYSHSEHGMKEDGSCDVCKDSETTAFYNLVTSGGLVTAAQTTSTFPETTFVLPGCYDGPEMIQKDSSDIKMCQYYEDMVSIHDMENTEVTIGINNVWETNSFLPEILQVFANHVPDKLRVFVHTNGIDAVSNADGADGFQCLDNEGEELDVDGESKLTVQCYQENEDEPFLAVVDVVITDKKICGTNSVSHPCSPDDNEILQSCSWRIVIPCHPNTMCTEEELDSDEDELSTYSPTTIADHTQIPTEEESDEDEPSTYSPTTMADHTQIPTEEESDDDEPSTYSPTTIADHTQIPTEEESDDDEPSTYSPTTIADHTQIPTEEESDDDEPSTYSPTTIADHTQIPSIPTIVVEQFGTDDSAEDDKFIASCPEDILLIRQDGVMEYSDDSVTIISQDSSSVTVQLTQTLTSSETDIDHIFYQYAEDSFDFKCYEEDNIAGGEIIDEITIACTEYSQTALLELWVADNKGLLSELDDANIPKCCHPDGVPQDTPVTQYVIEIKCVSVCDEIEEEFTTFSPTGAAMIHYIDN